MVLGLCERFHCFPDELDDQPAELLRLVAIAARGRKDPPEGGMDTGGF